MLGNLETGNPLPVLPLNFFPPKVRKPYVSSMGSLLFSKILSWIAKDDSIDPPATPWSFPEGSNVTPKKSCLAAQSSLHLIFHVVSPKNKEDF